MHRKTILIVDDDPAIRQGYGIRLRANGYQTSFAVDAVSAVSEACKNIPDLIILDLGLPAGDGFVVMERLSTVTSLSQIPVLVVSARDRETTKSQAIQAGAKGFLQKPVNDAVLLAYIHKILEDDGLESES